LQQQVDGMIAPGVNLKARPQVGVQVFYGSEGTFIQAAGHMHDRLPT
jgi:hypothetical protein